MRVFWPMLTMACLASAQQRVEPRAISIQSFTGQRGTTFTAVVRGTGLAGTTAASIGEAPFAITVEGVETEPPAEGRPGSAADLVKLRVAVRADAQRGRYPIRLITRNGISNALPLHIVDFPVVPEPAGGHETRESAVSAAQVPA